MHGMVFKEENMEYTQEQLDQIIADKVKEARQGLFTEDDLQRRVTSEVDRRVESGIQKGLDTQRAKWQQEYDAKSKLSAEELAKQQVEEQMKVIREKEAEINRKANLLEAKHMLSDAKVPVSQQEKLLGMLVSDDAEMTKNNIGNFIEMFDSTKTEIETQIKSKISNIPNPGQGSGEKPMTKQDFTKLGYAEKLAFKQSNPDQYKEFIG